jgi:hypothetical protein
MSRKHYTPEQIIGKLRSGAGMPKFLQKLPSPVGWLADKFMEFLLSYPLRENSATKEEPCGVKLGERDPRNYFLTAVAKVEP